MEALVQLAWPGVALVALLVVRAALAAWMRGVRSERQVLAKGLDELRARADKLAALAAEHDFEDMEERLAAAEERLGKLLTVPGAEKVLETVNLMVKDVTELKTIVVQLRDRAAMRALFQEEGR